MRTISRSAFFNIAQAVSASNLKIKNIADQYKSAFSVEPNRVEASLAFRFLGEVHEFTESADIGLLFYRHARPDFFGVPGYSLMSSPTIKIALERLAKYSPIIVDSISIALSESKENFTITALLNGTPSNNVPQYIFDAAAAVILGLINWLAHPKKIQPTVVELPYPKPAVTTSLEILFGDCIKYDSQYLSLSFHQDVKNAQVYTSNIALEDIHCRYADALLAERLDGSLTEKVCSALFAGYASGKILSLKDVSSALEISNRTLQKLLESEGVSFSGLHEKLMKDFAIKLFANPELSLKKIASTLGFSQQSSLNKACQRWFGSSPSQLRAKAR